MVQIGYKLMTELHGPRELVRNAVLAEEAGFDFAAISDHYHPWLESHGHSPFAWSVLGAVAHATSRMALATGLTCPIIRYHPAIVAQAAATIAVMSEGRFTLVLGAGERLNEHVVGEGWPGVDVRHEMLEEAIDVIRTLFEGGDRSFDGAYYTLDHARLYDLPDTPPAIVVGISGPKSAWLAAEAADGIMAVAPDPELVKAWKDAGGSGPRYGEIACGYAPSEEEGLDVLHKRFRFGALGWRVMAELPNVGNFEAATQWVDKESMADLMPFGPDPQTYVQAIREFADAGFDHVALVGAGPGQERFIEFYRDELAPALKETKLAA